MRFRFELQVDQNVKAVRGDLVGAKSAKWHFPQSTASKSVALSIAQSML